MSAPPPPPPPPHRQDPPPISKQRGSRQTQSLRQADAGEESITCGTSNPFRACDRGPRLWLLADLQVEPERQVGPTCGLVALHMAAKTLWARAAEENTLYVETCSVDELLASAVERGFSMQGEMFSATDLATLARDSCLLNARIVEDATAREVCGLVARGRCGEVASCLACVLVCVLGSRPKATTCIAYTRSDNDLRM